jgi:hypothetical protein
MESENFAFFANEYQKCQILTFCEVSQQSFCSPQGHSRNLTTDILKKKRVPKMTDSDILQGVPGTLRKMSGIWHFTEKLQK